MFTLALIFAGTNKGFGQMLPSSTVPQPGTCVSLPLHPRAGVPYTYEVSNPNGLAEGYLWWVTKETSFISAAAPNLTNMLTVTPGQLIAATPSYGVVGTGNNTISITWSPEILANTEYTYGGSPEPTFVVVAANGDCNDNLQVYEINPTPSFTVDITNIDPATNLPVAYDAPVEQCVDEVQSATYDAGTGEINMDYGTNTLYFEVIAANFVTNWKPSFRVESGSLQGDQTAAIGWAYTLNAAQAGTFIDTEVTGLVDLGTAGGATATALTADPTVTNTATGVSIFVRVVITNNTFESIADNDFILSVDGYDSTDQWDLVNSDCSDPGEDHIDQAAHTVTARPDIDHATNDATPTPDDFQPKN